MKKVKVYKSFVIALDKAGDHIIFTNDEWSFGDGMRYPEFECGSDIQEAIDFIDSY